MRQCWQGNVKPYRPTPSGNCWRHTWESLETPCIRGRPHVVPSVPAPPRCRAYQKDPAPCDALTTRGSLAGLTKKSLGFPPPRRVSYICLVGPRLRLIHPNSAALFSLANSPHIHDKCHPRLGHSLHAIHQTVTPGLSCKILSGWQPKISRDV